MAELDDGLHVRDSGSWAQDKLAIVECYLSAFTSACSRVSERYLVDGFAGPGVNRVRDTQELVPGSPLLALAAEPPFTRCLFMDLGIREVEALRARTAGDPRAVVVQGNVNRDLIPAMKRHLEEWPPCLCLLDPEGPDLAWETVVELSRFRRGKTPAELLILFPTHTGFIRELSLSRPITDWAERDLLRIFGHDGWLQIWEDRRDDRITSDTATTRYVELYADGLRSLGYRSVLDREIRLRGHEGQLYYFLIFATSHPAGHKIMEHCFDTVFTVEEAQQRLPGFTPPRRRRLR